MSLRKTTVAAESGDDDGKQRLSRKRVDGGKKQTVDAGKSTVLTIK